MYVCPAPAPSSTEQLLAVKCVADDPQKLSVPRQVVNSNLVKPDNCKVINDDTTKNGQRFAFLSILLMTIYLTDFLVIDSNITFSFQLPLPREGIQLDYSRWQQNLLTILIPDVLYD